MELSFSFKTGKQPRQQKQTTVSRVVSLIDNSFSKLLNPNATVGGTQLIANFETIPDLFIVTNFLAKRIAKIPVKVVKPSGKDAPNSELWKLIREPNFYQSWQDLVKTDYAYYNILGNSYLYGVAPVGFEGRITSLYCLPADKMAVVLTRDKNLPAYLNEIAGYEMNLMGTTYTLRPDQVLHNRFFNLRYDSGAWVYGISKYIPGDKINNELKAIYDSKTSIIKNRGAVGILSNRSLAPDEEQSKLVQQRLGEVYGLGEDQMKFIVTTQDLNYQQMAMNVQELQLIENGKYSFERLCQLSEIDPVIFTADGSTYANKEQAVKDLYKNVVKGEVDEFYNNLNQWISPGYGGEMIVPDWDEVQELERDKKLFTEMLAMQIDKRIITPLFAHEMLYGEYEGDNPPPDEYGTQAAPPPEPKPEEEDDDLMNEDLKKLFKINGHGHKTEVLHD